MLGRLNFTILKRVHDALTTTHEATRIQVFDEDRRKYCDGFAQASPYDRPLGVLSVSQSYITTDGQSASLSWYQAPIWGL
jgi:hypothetical protein